MIKRLTKILIFAPILTAALAFVLILFLQLFLSTDLARDLVLKRLNAALAGRVSWQNQSVSIFRGQIRLAGIEVFDPEGQPVITSQDLLVNLGLSDLVFGRVLVESARISRPEILLRRDSDGNLNLVQAFAAGQPGPESAPKEPAGRPPLNVRIKRLALSEGSFSFHTPAQDGRPRRPLLLREIDLIVTKADLFRKSGSLRFLVQGGRISLSGLDLPIDHFLLETTLARGGLDPLELELRSGTTRVAVSGSVAALFTDPEPDVRIEAAADLTEIRKILKLDPRVPPELAGRARLRASVAGNFRNPDVTVDLETGECRLAGFDFQKIALKARMRDRLVKVASLEAGLRAGPEVATLRASGRIDLQDAFAEGLTAPPSDLEALAWRLEAGVDNLALSSLPGLAGFRGILSGQLDLDSTGLSLENLTADLEASLRAGNFSLPGQAGSLDIDLTGRSHLEKGIASFQDLLAEATDFKIQGEGSYDISHNRLDLRTRSEVFAPGQLAAELGLDGISGGGATLVADISGPPARPVVEARLRVDQPGFKIAAADILEADMIFSGGRLDLSRLELVSQASRLTASGSLHILDAETFQPEPDPALTLAVNTNHIRLRDFFPEVAGRARLSADIAGSLGKPDGSITVQAYDLEFGGETIPEARLAAIARDGRIYLEPLEIFPVPEQALRVEGWVSLDRAWEVRFSSDPFDLAALEILEPVDLTGRAELTGQGAGRLEAPRLEALIQLSGLAAGGRAIPDMAIRAGLRDTTVTLDLATPFSLEAEYDLADHNFSGTAELPDTELAPFLKLAGLEGFSGSLAGSLQAAGNTNDIKNSRVDLNLTSLSLSRQEETLATARNLRAVLADGQITIPRSRINLPQSGYLELGGGGSLNRDLDITASGVVPVRAAAGFITEFESPRGRVLLEARIGGTITEPDFFAEVVLDDLGCNLVATMQRLRSVNGRIRLTGQDLTVSELSGRLGEGTFSVKGGLAWDNFVPARLDLDITAKALPVRIPDMMEMRLDAGLKLAGTPEATLLSGEIMLLDGLYFRDVNLSLVERAADLGKRKRRDSSRPERRLPDWQFFENLSLDISLGHRQPFIVDNNLALLSVRPQLNLGGTARNPIISGRAEISEGLVAYRETEFEVKKGTIDFVNPYRIEPEVDIRAESQVRQWTITLVITGTPKNLDFQLYSNPPAEDVDILSLLTTGKTTGEMGGSAGDGLSPEQMLAGLLADRLEQKVARETGLDIVEVEYRQNGTEDQDDQEVRVTVGKELSRRLTVTYGMESQNGEMVRRSSGIYRLLEDLSVKAYQDTAGSFGGEMRYRLEFR